MGRPTAYAQTFAVKAVLKMLGLAEITVEPSYGFVVITMEPEQAAAFVDTLAKVVK